MDGRTLAFYSVPTHGYLQSAIAEAAYRATVQAAGKNQKSLTKGWQALGLDKEKATQIFEEEAKEGFISARETMYGGQTQKYDKKGNRLNPDGSYENPEDAKKAEEESSEDAVSNVYECGECGYTLFIAQGRETKFFGEGFRCPECGASRDKFNARDDVEE
jgi:rubrerythrin